MKLEATGMKERLLLVLERTIAAVFVAIIVVLTLGVVIGTVRLFINLGTLAASGGVTGQYLKTISDVLTLFILVELTRSLVDYFSENRLRLTFIVDAAIVFVLREIMIKLFEHKIGTDEIYALSALLFVMGALRIASVLVFQRERQMMADNNG
ncbi:MAG TPA: hypothetical protein ENJ43_05795 [Gammaproteobacteria bacterium]|nr:hypothetical protein [Gammaproteobacteria bacterium]